MSRPDEGVHRLSAQVHAPNAGTCITKADCSQGPTSRAGQVIADGPNTEAGELALGRNAGGVHAMERLQL